MSKKDATAQESAGAVVRAQLYEVNINYHPDYDNEPDWRKFTKIEYLSLHELDNEDWAEMEQVGAIRTAP